MSLRIALIVPLLVATLRACEEAPVTEADAAALERSVGVNLHLEYDGSPYVQADRMAAALRFLGISQARDAAMRSGPGRLYRFVAVAKAGVRLDLFISRDIAGQLASLQALEARSPGAVAAIEGPNEANHEPFANGVAGDPRALQAYQAQLYRRAHAASGLAPLPVVSFTYWPPLGGMADAGNFHAYPAALKPIAPQLAWQRRLAEAVQPRGAPVVCTETGFPTAGKDALSEARQAELEPILLLENFRAGVRTTYLYELFDEHSDAGTAKADRENHWGLFRYDGSPKPAAVAIHRLMGLLRPGASVGGGDRPAPWVSLAGLGLRVLRVRRPDGVRLSFAWWLDGGTGRRIAVSSSAGAQVIDLATGAETHISGGREWARSGGGALVFVQKTRKPGDV